MENTHLVTSGLGVHFRVVDSFVSLAQQASIFEVPFFQSFLFVPTPHRFKIPSEQDITQFRKLCGKRFSSLYAHGAFWTNLADSDRSSHDGLWHQILLAQRLGFTHLIMHPGSFIKGTKQQGIEMVARTLNQIFLKEFHIQLVLENTAHGNRAVGSDLNDLRTIRSLLDKPERVSFCIDTAHAHVYGYKINSLSCIKKFFTEVEEILGIQSIALVHLNDAHEDYGSCKDRHAILGEGTIGEEVLKMAYRYYTEKNIPIIIEPPALSQDILYGVYEKIKNW